MPIDAQAAEIRKVKKHESGVVKDPISVSPGMTVRELLLLTKLMIFQVCQLSKDAS